MHILEKPFHTNPQSYSFEMRGKFNLFLHINFFPLSLSSGLTIYSYFSLIHRFRGKWNKYTLFYTTFIFRFVIFQTCKITIEN